MPNFDSGVSGYVTGRYMVEVNFPIDSKGHEDVCCNQCPYYGRSSKTCQLNKQMVHYPDKYIGVHCPLRLTTAKEEEEWNSET